MGFSGSWAGQGRCWDARGRVGQSGEQRGWDGATPRGHPDGAVAVWRWLTRSRGCGWGDSLTENPKAVGQGFPCSATQDPARVPAAPLRGGFRLWTAAETPHPTAFAPHVPVGMEGGDPEVGVQLLMFLRRSHRHLSWVRAPSRPAAPREGLRAQHGALCPRVARERPRSGGFGVCRRLCGGRGGLKTPQESQCPEMQDYGSLWSDGFVRVSTADE